VNRHACIPAPIFVCNHHELASGSADYHEAGHAVLAIALGRSVQRASIQPNSKRQGQCEIKKGRVRSSKDHLETDVLILLGGLAAEAKHTGEYMLQGAAQDLRAVRALIESRASSPRQVERLERRMLDKAEHLLHQPEIWLAVQLIAEELMRSTTISRRAAHHFYDQATAQVQADD
jgi:hypothetical protein